MVFQVASLGVIPEGNQHNQRNQRRERSYYGDARRNARHRFHLHYLHGYRRSWPSQLLRVVALSHGLK